MREPKKPSRIAKLLSGQNTGARRIGRAMTGDYALEDTRDPRARRQSRRRPH